MNGKSIFANALLLAGAVFSSSATGAAEAPGSSQATRVYEIPQSAGSGEDKELSILLDESHLKVATIALRRGTVLGTHSAPVPATLLILEGSGIIHVGGKPVAVSEGTLVSLAAGEEHDVVPKPASDMLVLVHYLRAAGGEATAECEHHGDDATTCPEHGEGASPHHENAEHAEHDHGH